MGTIALEQAKQISDLTVFVFGMGLTFVGLICIILICVIMGKICGALIKEQPNKSENAVSPAPKSVAIANKGEFSAAIAAAVAEENGTDVSGIKILSIKQL